MTVRLLKEYESDAFARSPGRVSGLQSCTGRPLKIDDKFKKQNADVWFQSTTDFQDDVLLGGCVFSITR